jgi:hypothetical protein
MYLTQTISMCRHSRKELFRQLFDECLPNPDNHEKIWKLIEEMHEIMKARNYGLNKPPAYVLYNLSAFMHDLPACFRYLTYQMWGRSDDPDLQEMIIFAYRYIMEYILNIFGYSYERVDAAGSMIQVPVASEWKSYMNEQCATRYGWFPIN